MGIAASDAGGCSGSAPGLLAAQLERASALVLWKGLRYPEAAEKQLYRAVKLLRSLGEAAVRDYYWAAPSSIDFLKSLGGLWILVLRSWRKPWVAWSSRLAGT